MGKGADKPPTVVWVTAGHIPNMLHVGGNRLRCHLSDCCPEVSDSVRSEAEGLLSEIEDLKHPLAQQWELDLSVMDVASARAAATC